MAFQEGMALLCPVNEKQVLIAHGNKDDTKNGAQR